MWNVLDIEKWISHRRSGIEGVRRPVEEIIAGVRERGDSALVEYTKKFDKTELKPENFVVTEEEREAAYDEVDAQLTESLIEAEARITQFHELQKRSDLWLNEIEPGVTLGVKTTPLDRIGTYVPGGMASYPSTALMTAVPARVAGVKEICCCTPPPINPLTILALDIAGVNEIYRIGGAQAIAAMALGTETINPVQKIVGPGNVFVTAAKMQLRDHAEIDFPAGPSEIGIIADETANPTFIAADILAQAEHDPNAACVLITTDESLSGKVGEEVRHLLDRAPRKDIIEKALAHSGYIIVRDLDEAILASDRIAPEHLSIQVADPLTVLNRVKNAGSIFVGPYAPVACGDYASGTNHVLPTAGYAQMYSGLNVDHFCKTSTIQIISREGLEVLGDITETLATAEGLHAHAESVRIRRK
ncbi:MAG: histidinol dehydrogenase [Euryarchaeota archaeon]|nr:histidinol dehydrogenase [Euryarchaeota archaeon]